jgi:hypothetical protein
MTSAIQQARDGGARDEVAEKEKGGVPVHSLRITVAYLVQYLVPVR